LWLFISSRKPTEGISQRWNRHYFQRRVAAFLAISERSSRVNFAARAAAPALPLRTLPGDFVMTGSDI
jgi:hypothetical protein